MMNNEFGELHSIENGKMSVRPTFCCGHCSDLIVMNPNRTRERKRCYECMKLICDRKQICQVTCTPIHRITRDHFEGPGAKKYGALANAILNGCETVDEAHERKLVIP